MEKTYHLTKTSFIAKCNKRGKIVEGMKSSKIRKNSKKKLIKVFQLALNDHERLKSFFTNQIGKTR